MITLISYSGKHGSMVYLRNYLSVMFNISDVMIDKEEIAMKMQLPIHITEDTLPDKNNSECVSESITDEQTHQSHCSQSRWNTGNTRHFLL